MEGFLGQFRSFSMAFGADHPQEVSEGHHLVSRLHFKGHPSNRLETYSQTVSCQWVGSWLTRYGILYIYNLYIYINYNLYIYI